MKHIKQIFTLEENDVLLCIEALSFYHLYSEDMRERADAKDLAVGLSKVVSPDTLQEAMATVDAMKPPVKKIAKRVPKKAKKSAKKKKS